MKRALGFLKSSFCVYNNLETGSPPASSTALWIQSTSTSSPYQVHSAPATSLGTSLVLPPPWPPVRGFLCRHCADCSAPLPPATQLPSPRRTIVPGMAGSQPRLASSMPRMLLSPLCAPSALSSSRVRCRRWIVASCSWSRFNRARSLSKPRGRSSTSSARSFAST